MFKYLFYRIVNFQMKIFGESLESAAISAFFSISLFWNLNLFTIFILLDKKHKVFAFADFFSNPNVFIPLFFLISLGVICYFIFFHNKKYLEIFENFEKENQTIFWKKNILAISYQILSFLFFILALLYHFSLPK